MIFAIIRYKKWENLKNLRWKVENKVDFYPKNVTVQYMPQKLFVFVFEITDID